MEQSVDMVSFWEKGMPEKTEETFIENENIEQHDTAGPPVAEPTDEPIVEPSAETVDEPTRENHQDSPVVQAKEAEISEDGVLEFLNRQLGTEYKTLSELNKKEEKSPFASPIVETINKFMSETGRDLNDWVRLQNMTSQLEQGTHEDIMRLKYQQENPNLSPEKVEKLFNSDFKKMVVDEDSMTEAEIAEAKEHNELVDIKLERNAAKAKQELMQIAESYKAPVIEKESNEGAFDPQAFGETFSSDYKNYLQETLEEVEFDLGDGETFSLKVEGDFKNTNVSNPIEFINGFLDEQGNFDMESWAAKMMVMQHADKIIRMAVNQKSSEAKEKLIKEEIKNVNIGVQEKQQQQTITGDFNSAWMKSFG
jgi:hypothetical protein